MTIFPYFRNLLQHTFHLHHHCYPHQVLQFLSKWKRILAEICVDT